MGRIASGDIDSLLQHSQRARPLTWSNPTTTCHHHCSSSWLLLEEAQAAFCSLRAQTKQTALSASRAERIHQEKNPQAKESSSTQRKRPTGAKTWRQALERQERIKRQRATSGAPSTKTRTERQLKRTKLTSVWVLWRKSKDLEADHSKAIEALEKWRHDRRRGQVNMVEQMKSEARAMAATRAQASSTRPRKRPMRKPRRLSSNHPASPLSTAWRTASRSSRSRTTTSRAASSDAKDVTSARWKRQPRWSSLWTTSRGHHPELLRPSAP